MLLTLSVGFFAAAVLGVQLGHSAIGAINPLYFEGAAPPPRAVDGRERQPAQPAYYQAYGWPQGAAARAVACADNCGPPSPYDPFAYVEPPPRLGVVGWSERRPPAELEPWPPGRVSDARDAAVVRYADFPIEAKPDDGGSGDGGDREDMEEPRADHQQADLYEE